MDVVGYILNVMLPSKTDNELLDSENGMILIHYNKKKYRYTVLYLSIIDERLYPFHPFTERELRLIRNVNNRTYVEILDGFVYALKKKRGHIIVRRMNIDKVEHYTLKS